MSAADSSNLIDTPADPTDDYPFARRLYFNSIKGFGGIGSSFVSGDESKLAACFTNRSTIDPAVLSSGFVTLDTTGARPVACEDFDERRCQSLTNVDACADTTIPVPFNP